MTEKNYSIDDVYESIGENENVRKIVDDIKDSPNEKDFLQWKSLLFIAQEMRKTTSFLFSAFSLISSRFFCVSISLNNKYTLLKV